MTDSNGITISGRLVERILLGVLVVAVGGGTVTNAVQQGEVASDSQNRDAQICGEIQEVREELAGLFEPFLDFPADQTEDPEQVRLQRAALQRIIDRLRAPHRCP